MHTNGGMNMSITINIVDEIMKLSFDEIVKIVSDIVSHTTKKYPILTKEYIKEFKFKIIKK